MNMLKILISSCSIYYTLELRHLMELLHKVVF